MENKNNLKSARMNVCLGLSFIWISLTFSACSKDHTSNPVPFEADKIEEQTSSDKIVNSQSSYRASLTTEQQQLVSRLEMDFGIVELSPDQTAGMEVQSFEDYESAAADLQNAQNQLINWGEGSSYEVNKESSELNSYKVNQKSKKPGTLKYFEPVGCGPGGYYAKISSWGGFFSSFSVAFQTTGSGVSSIDFYTTGLTLGWNWDQVYNHSYGNSGCVGGTITHGIGIGAAVFGFTVERHINYNWDSLNCTLHVSAGSGHC